MKKVFLLLVVSTACYGQSTDNMMTVPATPSWDTVNRQPAPKGSSYRESKLRESDGRTDRSDRQESSKERDAGVKRPVASK